MKALCIHAGPAARQHLQTHGLQPHDVGVIPAAAGGPKGLILGPLDRFLFGQWLPQSSHSVHLVGASIGAWRMAAACLDDPVAAFKRLEHDYIHQAYDLPAGQKRPLASHVSERFGANLKAFFGGRQVEVLNHPRYRLHVVTAHGRKLLAREKALSTAMGYLAAFMTNAVHRKALGFWLERVVFSCAAQGGEPSAVSAPATALPFGRADLRTQQVLLGEHNLLQALQASCSIPFVLQAVHDIPGAPAGAYWDGGLTDYHMHLAYGEARNEPSNFIANSPGNHWSEGLKDHQHMGQGAGLVLYPHFQSQVIPGWLDKALPWRHKTTAALDRMVLLSPHPDWVRSLPHAKLPDRRDFTHYGTDTAARASAWRTATQASQQLADEWAQWLHQPDMARVQAL